MAIDDRIVEVYSTDNPVVLQLITIKLSDHDIPVKVFDESISSVYHLQALSSRVMVHESNLSEARNIVKEIEESIARHDTDFDFKDADQADIEYEQEVFHQDKILKKASPRNLIIFLIILIMVMILLLLTFD